jgi:cytochrome P450
MRPEAAWAEAMKFENRPNPYPFFDELRKTPVAQVAPGLYAVTSYRDIITLSHDPRVSSDPRKISQKPAKAKAEPDAASADGYASPASNDPMMIFTDPPDHDRARRQAMRHFGPPHAPDVIPKMERDCQDIANVQLDAARGKTRLDVVDNFAYKLPVTVIFKILGVPMEDEPRLHDWFKNILAGLDLGPEAGTEEGKRRSAIRETATKEMMAYFVELLKGFARKPNDGMLSKMVNDDGPDGRMSPSELVNNTFLLLLAGHDSTVNLISHTVLTLLRNPGSVELLRRRPELTPGAIEESLRLQSSVQFFPSRCALEDIEVAGTVIPKNSRIFLMYGAGNRDPERFADPNKFDPERRDNQHLGWASGVHTCFGGALARLEVNTAIEVFVRRVENPRLVVDPPPYRPSQIFRGPIHLLIDYDRIRD